MTQGSSGGPWIQDFGIAAVGGVDEGKNQVIGVASYGDANANYKAQGASPFNNTFVDMYNAACKVAGNCLP